MELFRAKVVLGRKMACKATRQIDWFPKTVMGKRALIVVSYFYHCQTTEPHQNNLDFGPHVNRDE